MIRIACILAAFCSLFMFPFPATLFLAFIAALFIPPVAVFVGVLADFLYYAPATGAWPVATITGIVIAGLALLVRRFVKARII